MLLDKLLELYTRQTHNS